jgi:hypothetical protein|nr:MAG TPA: holin [Caudoviricetes sp.]
MKNIGTKLFVALLIIAVIISFAAVALAESVPASGGFQINLTGVIVSLLVLLFNVLLAWIAKVVVPPLKEWLAAKTTTEQRGLMYTFVKELVAAAEQTIVGAGLGSEKMQYVIDGLKAKGITVDIDMIEAAVKEMNDAAEERLASIFGFEQEDNDEANNTSESEETQ